MNKNLEICKRIVPKQSEMTSNEMYDKYLEFNPKNRTRDTQTLYRDIRFCRMYYQYLKLCVELESKNLKVQDHTIKLDKRKFKQFDLDLVLNSNFDTFFKSHRHLFVEESVELMSSSDSFNDEYLYFKVPKNRSEKVMINEIKSLMKNRLVIKDSDLFSTNKVPYMRLHIEYNCLIMSINEYSRKEIQDFINEKYKNYDFIIQKKKSVDPRDRLVLSVEQSVSRVVSRGRDRLIQFSKDRIFP